MCDLEIEWYKFEEEVFKLIHSYGKFKRKFFVKLLEIN
jgi:hypothetical protein